MANLHARRGSKMDKRYLDDLDELLLSIEEREKELAEEALRQKRHREKTAEAEKYMTAAANLAPSRSVLSGNPPSRELQCLSPTQSTQPLELEEHSSGLPDLHLSTLAEAPSMSRMGNPNAGASYETGSQDRMADIDQEDEYLKDFVASVHGSTAPPQPVASQPSVFSQSPEINSRKATESVKKFLNQKGNIIKRSNIQTLYMYTQGTGKKCQLGSKYPSIRRRPQLVETSFKPVSIIDASVGMTSSLVLWSTGEVLSWGYGPNGELGSGAGRVMDTMPLRIDFMVPVAMVASGARHCALVTDQGQLYTWGSGSFYKLGLGPDTRDQSKPQMVTALKGHRVVSLSLGWEHNVCIVANPGKDTTTVFSWGNGKVGALGHGELTHQPYPREITSFNPPGCIFMSAVCGAHHTMLISTDGKVYSCGLGDDGRLGHGNTEQLDQLKRIDHFVENDVHVATAGAGFAHNIALDDRGRVFTWGLGHLGQLGHGSQKSRLYPAQVKGLDGQDVVDVTCGPFNTAAITHMDGRTYLHMWGMGEQAQLGLAETHTTSKTLPTCLEDFLGKDPTMVCCSNDFSLIIASEKEPLPGFPVQKVAKMQRDREQAHREQREKDLFAKQQQMAERAQERWIKQKEEVENSNVDKSNIATEGTTEVVKKTKLPKIHKKRAPKDDLMGDIMRQSSLIFCECGRVHAPNAPCDNITKKRGGKKNRNKAVSPSPYDSPEKKNKRKPQAEAKPPPNEYRAQSPLHPSPTLETSGAFSTYTSSSQGDVLPVETPLDSKEENLIRTPIENLIALHVGVAINSLSEEDQESTLKLVEARVKGLRHLESQLISVLDNGYIRSREELENAHCVLRQLKKTDVKSACANNRISPGTEAVVEAMLCLLNDPIYGYGLEDLSKPLIDIVMEIVEDQTLVYFDREDIYPETIPIVREILYHPVFPPVPKNYVYNAMYQDGLQVGLSMWVLAIFHYATTVMPIQAKLSKVQSEMSHTHALAPNDLKAYIGLQGSAEQLEDLEGPVMAEEYIPYSSEGKAAEPLEDTNYSSEQNRMKDIQPLSLKLLAGENLPGGSHYVKVFMHSGQVWFSDIAEGENVSWEDIFVAAVTQADEEEVVVELWEGTHWNSQQDECLGRGVISLSESLHSKARLERRVSILSPAGGSSGNVILEIVNSELLKSESQDDEPMTAGLGDEEIGTKESVSQDDPKDDGNDAVTLGDEDAERETEKQDADPYPDVEKNADEIESSENVLDQTAATDPYPNETGQEADPYAATPYEEGNKASDESEVTSGHDDQHHHEHDAPAIGPTTDAAGSQPAAAIEQKTSKQPEAEAGHGPQDSPQEIDILDGDGTVQNLVERLLYCVQPGENIAIKASKASLGDAQILLLCDALPKMKGCLCSIDVTWNKVTPAGAEALAAALPTQSLHRVALCHNLMGDEGIAHIARRLSGSPSLKIWHSWDNQVTDQGAESLREVIINCPELHEMGCGKNAIGEAGIRILIESLRERTHRKLNAFMLNGNPGLTDAYQAEIESNLFGYAGDSHHSKSNGAEGESQVEQPKEEEEELPDLDSFDKKDVSILSSMQSKWKKKKAIQATMPKASEGSAADEVPSDGAPPVENDALSNANDATTLEDSNPTFANDAAPLEEATKDEPHDTGDKANAEVSTNSYEGAAAGDTAPSTNDDPLSGNPPSNEETAVVADESASSPTLDESNALDELIRDGNAFTHSFSAVGKDELLVDVINHHFLVATEQEKS